jgi:hypothetical protein
MRGPSSRFAFGGRMAVTVIPSSSTSTSARTTSPTLTPEGRSDPSRLPLGWRAPAARQVQLPSGRELVSSISIRGIPRST